MFCLQDFQEEAKKKLSKVEGGAAAWDYYSSGANQQQSLRDNMEGFSRYRLRPRILQDVSQINLQVQVQGEWVESPVGVAPTAMQKLAHEDGEVATAQACVRTGTCMIVSSWSTTSLEDVTAAARMEETSLPSSVRWFQLYVYRDRELTARLVDRAERAGYKALVITVDTPILGRRLADARNKFNLPSHLQLANFDEEGGGGGKGGASKLVMSSHDSGLHQYTKELIDPSLDWKALDWLCKLTRLPVILKGILRREDAEEALRHNGVRGIIVSNHGARQMDGVPATIDALAEVVSAVKGKIEVYLDGGVRQGTDVLKALALGAKAVFVGRPILWGLVCGGREGVEQVLDMLREELSLAMKLAGVRNVSEIPSDLVVHEDYYKHPLARL